MSTPAGTNADAAKTTKSRTKEIVALTGLVMLLTVALKPLGIIKEMVVAAYFGVSGDMDAYFLMLSIPVFLSHQLYRTAGGCMTPIYLKLKGEGKEREAGEFLSTVIWTYLAILAAVFLTCMVFQSTIVRIFAPGFSGERLTSALRFAGLAFPLVFIMGVNGFCRVILEARKQFVVTKLTQGFIPVCMLGWVLSAHHLGVSSLFFGLITGYVLAVLTQAAWIYKSGIRIEFVWHADSEAFGRLRRLIAPLMLGNLLAASSAVVDRGMISLLSEGDLGLYGYAQILLNNISLVFVGSLATTLLPIFSDIRARGNENFGATLGNTFCLTTFVMFPVGLVLAVYAVPAIELIYERGKFTADDTVRVAQLLAIYAFSLTFEAAIVVFARAYNALLDAKTTMFGGIINLLGNVSLNYILMRYYGVYGIALATVLVNAAVVVFFAWRMKVRHGIVVEAGTMVRLLKIIAIALVAAVLGRLTLDADPGYLNVAMSASLASLVFIALAWLLKVPELMSTFAMVRRRLPF